MNTNKLIKWIKDYRIFVFLTLAMVILVGSTGWINRPNSMKKARYTVERDFEDAVGSYDFSAERSELEYGINTKIKDLHFRLEEGYCIASNSIEICVNGYELFDVDKTKSVISGYKEGKTKHFMMANVTVRNNSENDVTVGGFGYASNDKFDFIRPVSNERNNMNLSNNLADHDISKGDGAVIKPGEEVTGTYVYGLSNASFSQLYFEGGISLDMPEVIETDNINRQYLFTEYRKIEMPVVPVVLESYRTSLEGLPVQMLRSGYGYTSVTNSVKPNLEFENEDGTLKVVIMQIEDGVATYKPSYFDGHSRSSYKNNSSKYSVMKVKIFNNTNTTLDSYNLQVSLGLRSDEYPKKSDGASREYIKPNESREIVFDFGDYNNETVKYPSGEPLKFVLTSNGVYLLEANFIIEE